MKSAKKPDLANNTIYPFIMKEKNHQINKVMEKIKIFVVRSVGISKKSNWPKAGQEQLEQAKIGCRNYPITGKNIIKVRRKRRDRK